MLGSAVEERQAQRSYRSNGVTAETFVQVSRSLPRLHMSDSDPFSILYRSFDVSLNNSPLLIHLLQSTMPERVINDLSHLDLSQSARHPPSRLLRLAPLPTNLLQR